MRKINIEKLLERHQREWKKCLNSDSNRDPPAYVADCSAVELLRPRLDSKPEDILTISLQLLVRHTDATLAFSASPTGPPRSDPQTRAVKEDIT